MALAPKRTASPAGALIGCPIALRGPLLMRLIAVICAGVRQVEVFAPVHCNGCPFGNAKVAGSNFESYLKQKKQHSEIGKRVQSFIRRNPMEDAGPDDHPSENLSDDGRLAEDLGNLARSAGVRR